MDGAATTLLGAEQAANMATGDAIRSVTTNVCKQIHLLIIKLVTATCTCT